MNNKNTNLSLILKFDNNKKSSLEFGVVDSNPNATCTSTNFTQSFAYQMRQK